MPPPPVVELPNKPPGFAAMLEPNSPPPPVCCCCWFVFAGAAPKREFVWAGWEVVALLPKRLFDCVEGCVLLAAPKRPPAAGGWLGVLPLDVGRDADKVSKTVPNREPCHVILCLV